MNKFLAITTLFIATLAGSGAAWAQSKSVAQKPATVKTHVAATKTPEVKSVSHIATGQISQITTKTKTLTVREGTKTMTFLWDEHTKITEAGHGVKSSALVSGARVTVHYIERGGQNRATAITITPGTRPAKHS
jgi:hypothetical protein